MKSSIGCKDTNKTEGINDTHLYFSVCQGELWGSKSIRFQHCSFTQGTNSSQASMVVKAGQLRRVVLRIFAKTPPCRRLNFLELGTLHVYTIADALP